MIHFRPVSARILVKGDDKARLEQYAGTFDCRIVSEIIHFPNQSLERVYRFHCKEQKNQFLKGLFCEAKIM